MRVVDRSAWIEWLVSTLVQLELAKFLAREVGEDKADQVIAFTETCLIADLDTAITLSAATLSARHRLATADAIIYATAQARGADLLTCNNNFAALPGIKLILKPAAP